MCKSEEKEYDLQRVKCEQKQIICKKSGMSRMWRLAAGSPSLGLGPAASAIPGNYLEKQILRSQPQTCWTRNSLEGAQQPIV